MRTLVLALVLSFSCVSVASACDCGGLTEKQVKKIQERFIKQKANKHSKYNECIRAKRGEDSCKAELITNFIMGI